MATQLICPNCKGVGQFSVRANMKITVSGLDCDQPVKYSDIADIVYGSESMCSCMACGHVEKLGQFIKYPSGMVSLDDYASADFQSIHSEKCSVIPIRPGTNDVDDKPQ